MRATRTSARSPARWPSWSLTNLKWSRSPTTTLSRRPPRRAASSCSSISWSSARRFLSWVSGSVSAASARLRTSWVTPPRTTRSKTATGTITPTSVIQLATTSWVATEPLSISTPRYAALISSELEDRLPDREEVGGVEGEPGVQQLARERRGVVRRAAGSPRPAACRAWPRRRAWRAAARSAFTRSASAARAHAAGMANRASAGASRARAAARARPAAAPRLAKMPLPTRAAKRVLGSTGGTAGACGASRWATGGSCSTVERSPPGCEGGARMVAESPRLRALGAELLAQRLQLLAQRGHLVLEALDADGEAVVAGGGGRCGSGRRGRGGRRRRRALRPRPPPPPPAGARSAARARPGRRGSATASSRSTSSSSVRSSSSPESKRCMRSLRWRSSPGVCGPRSISTADQRELRVGEAERLVEQVLVLDRARGRPARQRRPLAPPQPVQRRADRRLVVVHHRVAVGRLVARQPQRVERERVLVRRRALLLDQARDHPDLDCVRFHGRVA